MGMYDTIHSGKRCPECNKGELIVQTKCLDQVLKDYHLDSPESLAEELTEDDIQRLYIDIKDEYFYCDNYRDDCRYTEQIYHKPNKEVIESRVNLINKLFNSSEEE